MPGPDLHLHSTASDGAHAPAELVRLAHAAALPAIAITDHDTVAGTAEVHAATAGLPIVAIPGVELSAGLGDRGMHILGYHIDHTDARLLARLADLRRIRLERAERIVHALAHDGFRITVADVLASADEGSVGRAHIARLLVETGQAPSVSEAFRTLLGKTAPYYIPKPVHTPEEIVAWIAEAGGVAVLAHPGLSEVDDLIPGLVAAGLAGLEVYHPSHDATRTEQYALLAASLGLIATGGSDFHGLNREGDTLGSVSVPERVVADLERAVQDRSVRS